VTVVSNHFKSKGDSNLQDLAEAAQAYLDGGGTGITQAQIDALTADPNYDQNDGQGFWNAVRAEAAQELADWLDTAPTGAATDNILITGDLNAYGREDPVMVLADTGYAHLVGGGSEDYGFTFFGAQGALDHAFASPALASQVTGAAEWHINADEPVFLDYNTDFEDPAFFAADTPFRASDHDPVLVGLDLSPDDVFATALPDLRNGRAVEASEVNGVVPQSFLSGDQAASFTAQVLKLPGNSAGFKSSLGVYEVTQAGDIVDAQLLFGNVKQAANRGTEARIADVEEGNDLGFFLVQNGADWARTLEDSDTFSFVDSAGDPANLSDGPGVFLAVNGIASGLGIVHSYDAGLNAGGREQVLSAFDMDAGALTIAFEDLLRGGDLDYGDVIIRISEGGLDFV
jgi:hypothetical protein